MIDHTRCHNVALLAADSIATIALVDALGLRLFAFFAFTHHKREVGARAE
jgi:hypothetical protein